MKEVEGTKATERIQESDEDERHEVDEGDMRMTWMRKTMNAKRKNGIAGMKISLCFMGRCSSSKGCCESRY